MWTIFLISKPWWWLLKPKRLTSTLHLDKFTYLDYYVFLLSSYCRILIHIYFHTVLSKKTNRKYILTGHLTWMTSKRSVCMKTYLSLRISLKGWRIYLISWKIPTFSNIFPRDKHVLNTFELRTLYARLYVFVVYILFAPVIQQASIAVWTIFLISKSCWWLLKPKRFTQ